MGQRFGNGELRQTFRRIHPGWPLRVATLGVRERAGAGQRGRGNGPQHLLPVGAHPAAAAIPILARVGGAEHLPVPAEGPQHRAELGHIPANPPPPPPPHQLSRPMHTHSALPSSIQKAAQHHARSLVAATPAATRHDALIHCAPCVRGGRGTAGGAYALGRPAARHDAQKAARNAAPPHADATVAVPGGPRPLGPPATLTDGSAAIRTLARARPRTAR